MTTDEARNVLEMMTQFMDRAFSYTQLKALEVAIAALEKSEIPIFCNQDKPKVIRKDDGKLFEVWKILFSADGTTSVWSGEWSGHHKIGVDCEFEPAPVYHYLPEVPEDGEIVFAYCESKPSRATAMFHASVNAFRDGVSGKYITPYAWTRIPPKPLVKPTEDES